MFIGVKAPVLRDQREWKTDLNRYIVNYRRSSNGKDIETKRISTNVGLSKNEAQRLFANEKRRNNKITCS